MAKLYRNLIPVFCFFLISFFIFPKLSTGQFIHGKIMNEKGEPVPYATIFVTETKEGTITNSDGNFSLSLENGTYHLIFRSLGYFQTEKQILLNVDTLKIDITLQQQEYTIKEIKVFPGKEDPAYYIIRKAIVNAAYFREKIKHYEADLYIKSNFRFTNIPRLYQNKIEINGKKLKEAFNEGETYVIESQNKITFDYPQKYKQEVISKKTSLTGFDEPPVMGLMTSGFYEERSNELISPLSSMALKHYNFRYDGFITVGNFDVFKIRVEPKRKSDELVTGYIYIVDRLWCIYNVDFKAQIKFFRYNIKQQYENLGNNNWMPVSHVIEGDLSILGLKADFYYGASLKYTSIEENMKIQTPTGFEPVTEKEKTINEKEVALRKKAEQLTEKEELTNQDVRKAVRLDRKILKEQYSDPDFILDEQGNYKIEDSKDSLIRETFSWDTIRAIPLTQAEIRSYEKMDSLLTLKKMETDSVLNPGKKKNNISKIIGGNSDFCKDSLIVLGYSGIISLGNADFNTVDGYKYKQTIKLTVRFDSVKFISLVPEIGYAFNRKSVFGSVQGRIVNILQKNNQLDVGIGKVSRDFKYITGGIDPSLNSISSWFFAQNYMKLFETTFLNINTAQKVSRNFNIIGKLDYNHFSPLENIVNYRLSDKKEYSPNIPKGYNTDSPELAEQKSFVYGIGFNFTKRQSKPWLQKSDFLMVSDFYRLQFTWKQGVKSVLGSESDFGQFDLKFEQQANLSPTAAIVWQANAGIFPKANRLHFSQYKHFKISEIAVPFETFTNTFQLLNDYEYSTNKKYFHLGGEFKTEYLLFRYLSVFNKRTWNESLHLNYLTTPALKNYWEAGYSLNNLFFMGNIGFFTGFKGSNFENVGVKVSLTIF